MRPAWARGSNYDRQALKFYTATKGFTIGESLLGGPDLLGADGPDVELQADFTSCTINTPCTVEQGLFVHREVETCQLTGTLPGITALEGKRLAVKYQAFELFRGTIRDPQWTETVDVNRDYLPGNTPVKSYRFAVTATNGEERLATQPTPPRNFLAPTPRSFRLQDLTGWLTGGLGPATDLPVYTDNIGSEMTSYAGWFQKVTTADQLGPMLDTIRGLLRLHNESFEMTPGSFHLNPNNRWIGGDTIADALTFTDEPYAQTPYSSTEEYVGSEQFVGYTSRQYGTDPDLWVGKVLITWSTGGVDFTAGPYGVGESQVTVDLGVSEWVEPTGTVQPLTARVIAASLPLKSRPRAATRSLTAPLQSSYQLLGTLPAMALVKSDGVTERVAVLGQVHQITPEKWTIAYDMGPHHLLDRQSDLDPSTPIAVSVAVDPGDPFTTRGTWKVPHLPDGGGPWYIRVVRTEGELAGITSYGQVGHVLYHWVASTLTEGTEVFVSWNTNMQPVGTSSIWVLYTNNPSPDQGGVLAPQLREGLPAYLGDFTRP